SPHYIELENRWIADTRVEPLHVQLMSLRCIVRSPLQLDANSWIELHEALQLLRDQRSLGAERGAGEGENSLVFGRALGAPGEEKAAGKDAHPATCDALGANEKPGGGHALRQRHPRKNELNRKISHVPELDICARSVTNGPERPALDLVAPELIVLETRLLDRAIHFRQGACEVRQILREAKACSTPGRDCRRAVDLASEAEQDQVDLSSPDHAWGMVCVRLERLPNARGRIGIVGHEWAQSCRKETNRERPHDRTNVTFD